MAVKGSLYEQFKSWFKQKYGWGQSLAIPSNTDELMFNPYFYSFLEENRLWAAAPETRRNYEQSVMDNLPPDTPRGPYNLLSQAPPTTSPASTSPTPPQIVSQDGYDWQWIPDMSGTGGMWNLIGTTKTANDEPTWYQREQAAQGRTQLGIEQANIMNQQRAQELGRADQALQFEQHRIGMRNQDNTAGLIAQERAKMADQFNQLQQMIMSGTAPRDWVIRETARGTTNPFVDEPVDWAEGDRRAMERVASSDLDLRVAMKELKDLEARRDDSIKDNNPQEWEIKAANYRVSALQQEKMTARKVMIENRRDEPAPTTSWGAPSSGEAEEGYAGGGGSIQAKTKPFAPNIPAGVIPFLESPEFGSNVVPTSGQQWFNTSPTAQQQLFGYLESQKQSPEDYLWNMQRSLPQAPSLGRRSAPARQI